MSSEERNIESHSGSLHSSMSNLNSDRAPIPKNKIDHKKWSNKMATEFHGFQDLGAGEHEMLITVLRKITELDADKAQKIADEISNFFRGISQGIKGDPNNTKAFLEEKRQQVEEVLKKQLN